MTFSHAKKDLMLSVVVNDQQKMHDQLDRSLGVLWDLEDLTAISASPKGGGVAAVDLSKPQVRVPLGLAISGEFYAKLAEPYQNAKKKKEEVEKTLEDKGFIDVGQLSPAEAKAFWKNLR